MSFEDDRRVCQDLTSKSFARDYRPNEVSIIGDAMMLRPRVDEANVALGLKIKHCPRTKTKARNK